MFDGFHVQVDFPAPQSAVGIKFVGGANQLLITVDDEQPLRFGVPLVEEYCGKIAAMVQLTER